MSAKKVTLVNKEVLNLFQGLLAVKEMKGSRFAVLVAKNLKEMKKVLDPLDAMAIPTQEFQELSVEMNKLIEAEDGEAIKKLEESNSELIDPGHLLVIARQTFQSSQPRSLSILDLLKL